MGKLINIIGKHRLEVEFIPTYIYSDMDKLFQPQPKKYLPTSVALHIDLDSFLATCHTQRGKHPRSNVLLPYLEFESEEPIPYGIYTFILPYKDTRIIFSDVRLTKYSLCKIGYSWAAGNYQWVMI